MLMEARKREEQEMFEEALEASRRRREEQDEFAELLGYGGDPWAH
jgi:hypothetical protein